MEIIPATTEHHIQQVAALAREIWSEHFPPIIGPAQVAYMLDTIQSVHAITKQIQNQGYTYFLIEENGQAFGYCAYALKDDRLFLSKLYILKSMRNNGIARNVIEYLRSIAAENNLNKITLTVNKNNAGPIAAYEKLGFIKAGPVVQDIGGGFVMDDYGMELRLT